MRKLISKPKIIVILGPTAVGKSDMAVEVALFLQKNKVPAEIISADSRQIYTGLNIGAGKITKKEMKSVVHHGLDIVSPKRKKLYSVAEFKAYTDQKIQEIVAYGAVPIICGGTGFYIDAIVDGTVLPDVPPNSKLRNTLSKKSTEYLYTLLKKLDSKRARVVDQHNKVRLVRAIEIAKALGKVPKIKKHKLYNPLIIGLNIDKDALCQKVHTRALKRLKIGMITEAKKLKKSGVSWKRMKEFGLEYGLLAKMLRGELNRKQFIERLLIETWQYAKRQRTWFSKRAETKWFDPRKSEAVKEISKICLGFLNAN
jgi:tRNA dimethylallyltransferase